MDVWVHGWMDGQSVSQSVSDRVSESTSEIDAVLDHLTTKSIYDNTCPFWWHELAINPNMDT